MLLIYKNVETTSVAMNVFLLPKAQLVVPMKHQVAGTRRVE